MFNLRADLKHLKMTKDYYYYVLANVLRYIDENN